MIALLAASASGAGTDTDPAPASGQTSAGRDLARPAPAAIDETIVTPTRDGEEPPHWVDTSHQFATNRAQALVQWMDDFFGAEVRDAERADTFVRVIAINDWDQRDGHDPGVRLRGQVSLPKVSRRVDLIFSGEEAEQTLSEADRASESDVGVRVNFRDGRRSRFDATVSLRSGPALLPGLRYRYQQPFGNKTWGRVTQRLQYHTDDGYRSLTNVDLNRTLAGNSVVRWGARLRYREDLAFWDWNVGLSYRHWLDDHEKFPSAIEYYAALTGVDEPDTFTTNYRAGVLYRRQFFREFLFFEVEPNLNWRRDEFEDGRELVAGIVLRLEIMLDDDLVGRARRPSRDDGP